MEIRRGGSRGERQGPAEYFTGVVRIEPLFEAPEGAKEGGAKEKEETALLPREDSMPRVAVASVTFEPGARTAWHTHPLGQTLIVVSGRGWAQSGGRREEIGPGDVVWFPPGERHWHGATATSAMTHIAIQERLDGKAAEWLEKVSDEQYRA